MPRAFQVELPSAAQPPLAAAGGARLVHLVAPDEAGTGGMHVTLDDRGRFLDAWRLPFSPAAVSATEDGSVVTGGTGGRPVWVRLSPDGRALRRGSIAPAGELLLWPRPLDQDTLVWATDPERLRVWTAHADEPERAELVLAGSAPTVEVAIARCGDELAVATVDTAGVLALSTATARIELDVREPVSPQLAVVGSTLVLAVASRGGTIELRRFDSGLRPSAETLKLAAVAPGRPRAVRLAVGPEAAYVGWQVASSSGSRVEAAGCVLDRDFEPVGDVRLGPAGPFDAAAWVGSTLVVAHGAAPTITGLRPR